MPLRDPVQAQAVEHYTRRLLTGVSRSAALKAFPTRTVKRIDLARLRIARPDAPESLLHTLVEPEARYKLTFEDYRRQDEAGEARRALFTTLRNRLARDAQAAHRETGLWMLWLAYPLLYAPHPSRDRDDFLLAPLFLWSVRIDSTGLSEGEISFVREGAVPRFNRVAWQWIRRNLDFDPPEPTPSELLELTTFEKLRESVQRYTAGFRLSLDGTLIPRIVPVPERKQVSSWDVPRLLDAGILGLIRWENMELLADLGRLHDMEELAGPAGEFLRERQRLDVPLIEVPREKDRFLITDTDASQERAIWASRRQEGVVVHGPPGTGKSQVIVNIVADVLAHGETVLVVCQKKAALDVVASRLSAAGLGDLLLQVDDAEGDRRRIIESLRSQEPPVRADVERRRAAGAAEIEQLESRFEAYSKALFSLRERRGTNYRAMLARISRIQRNTAGIRPLPALRKLLSSSDETSLRQLCEALEGIERLYFEAEVADNPWMDARQDLAGDPYEMDEIRECLGDGTEAYGAADTWAARAGPAGLPLVGDLAEIEAAAARLGDAWPRLERQLLRPVRTEVDAREIDDATFRRAAEAATALVRHQGSIVRFLRPAFYRARNLLGAFGAVRPWVEDASADGIFRAIAKRARDAAACERYLRTLGAWIDAAVVDRLVGELRAGRPVAGYLQRIQTHLPLLPVLLRYRATLAGLGERDRQVVAALVEDAEATPRAWSRVTELSALLEWVADAERESPILREMTPEIHRTERVRLVEAARAKRQLEATAIRSRWAAEWEGIDHRWRRGLRFRGPNSVRLREVVETGLRRGLLDLRPCWLANPGTTSQILPLEHGVFDVVVFDEASQCPPEYALPALYRGRRVVVAGDGKQLPPTMFFRSTFDFDTEEEAAEREQAVEDKVELGISTGAEDLLFLAQARLPDAHLNVHYRSIDPQLIAFSNAAFYGNRLEAPRPPSTTTADGATALSLERVDGVYRPDRTNPEEARRVVACLRRLWLESDARPTVGVVTFNEAQREEIEDLLDAEAARDVAFRCAFEREQARRDGDQDVGFFVKSLEAVQGDERDVILFSTTYGRREDGRFSRSFLGPINQAGGERRLNVAITRARQWVRIFTSLPIAELADALGAGSVQTQETAGRAMLQLYLAFAERVTAGDESGAEAVLLRALKLSGTLGPQPASSGEEESEFEVEVREALRDALGLEIDSQVSSGAFRIDLAVRSPGGGYLLGIECDGKAYHSAASARAYDHWRQSLLEERGWRIHRVWSTSWWRERQREIERVQFIVRAALGERSAAREAPAIASGVGSSVEAPGETQEACSVAIGKTVTYRYEDEPSDVRRHRILDGRPTGRLDAIGASTPLARALLGRHPGEVVSLARFGGPTRLVRVLAVE